MNFLSGGVKNTLVTQWPSIHGGMNTKSLPRGCQSPPKVVPLPHLLPTFSLYIDRDLVGRRGDFGATLGYSDSFFGEFERHLGGICKPISTFKNNIYSYGLDF